MPKKAMPKMSLVEAISAVEILRNDNQTLRRMLEQQRYYCTECRRRLVFRVVKHAKQKRWQRGGNARGVR